MVIGHYTQNQHSSLGYAAVQQVTLISDYFRIIAQFVLFHVGDWENRIYLHEPSFYYSFCFPAYYGKGQKTSLLLTCKLLKRFSVSTKISVAIKEGKTYLETGIQLHSKL